jgi:integrase/recombinase XerD
MKCIVDVDVVLSRPLVGPLSSQIAPFAVWAREQGYALRSRCQQVRLAAGFSRWLGEQAVSVGDLSAEHVSQYLALHAGPSQLRRGDAAILRRLVEFLRREGVAATEKAAPCRLTPVEQEIERFTTYLRSERALSEATVANYVPFVCSFLRDRFGNGQLRLSELSGADVVRFVQRQAPRLHRKRAKLLTTALRSFLHFLRYCGEIHSDLAVAVPCVADWSMGSIPRAIAPDAVRRLLGSLDRSTPLGLRNYAVLLLLARLGLRAAEVAFLELDDIDWAAGQLSVRAKGGERTALPLSVEVGEAIAAYLQHGRPPSSSRRVFLRLRAPIRGFLEPTAIAGIVRLTLARAQVTAPSKGAHQFRHALAVQMLNSGASLAEIGELLRHRSPQTTTIYAKVDLGALRPLALPWPGGAR